MADELFGFEKIMIRILTIIQFKMSKNGFPKELWVRMDEIKKTGKILIMGDETKQRTPREEVLGGGNKT